MSQQPSSKTPAPVVNTTSAKSKSKNRRLWMSIGAGAVLLAAGGWAINSMRNPSPTAPPAEIIKFMATDKFASLTPDQQKPYRDAYESIPRDQRRDAFESAKLTDDERDKMFANTRGQEEQKRVDAYFALATQAERDKYLDQQIDTMQKRMAEWKSRATTQPANANRPPGGGGGPNGPGGNGPGGQNRNDPARIKRRIESTPPAQQAKSAEFREAMKRRMEARGIKPPWENRRG